MRGTVPVPLSFIAFNMKGGLSGRLFLYRSRNIAREFPFPASYFPIRKAETPRVQFRERGPRPLFPRFPLVEKTPKEKGEVSPAYLLFPFKVPFPL
jgi:hypothetical protein